jgi:Transglutaminase-like superfamily
MRVLRKFTCLPPADRRLLFTATLVLGLVGAALRLNPLPPSSERITWAISAVGRRIPLLSRCLTQAVAAKILLARCGYPALMRIGVSRNENGRLEAHAWVESQGVVVMGAPAAGHFIPLPRIDRGNR